MVFRRRGDGQRGKRQDVPEGTAYQGSRNSSDPFCIIARTYASGLTIASKAATVALDDLPEP